MKTRRYIIIITSILCLSLIFAACTYKTNAVGLNDIAKNPEVFAKTEENNSQAIRIGNVIVWLVRTVGESIAIIMLIVIGIKYVLGSVEEKAEYKQSMWPYIIGAVLIFAGAALTDIIYKAFN